MCCRRSPLGKRGEKVLALLDVRKAYLYGMAFVELPPEDYQPSDEHMCGPLRYSLYGTRDAAQNWEEELASSLSSLKLTRGSSMEKENCRMQVSQDSLY